MTERARFEQWAQGDLSALKHQTVAEAGLSHAQWKERERALALEWSVVILAAPNLPAKEREAKSWLFLLEWATLGGKPDDVIPETEEIGRFIESL